MRKENVILEKTISFSLAVIDFCEVLNKQQRQVISRQLLKSATSIGANVHEAQNCESKADFVHKMKIAAKEAEETKYWLTLCERSDKYPFDEKLKLAIKDINLIIYKILSTSIKNNKLK